MQYPFFCRGNWRTRKKANQGSKNAKQRKIQLKCNISSCYFDKTHGRQTLLFLFAINANLQVRFLLFIVLRCPPLYPPLNGKLVNPKCGNLYESKCYVMCDQGFTLKGEKVRKCERNGNNMYWTGNPKCEGKTRSNSSSYFFSIKANSIHMEGQIILTGSIFILFIF